MNFQENDVAMFEIHMLAHKMMSLINKLADSPPNYHKTAGKSPHFFCTPTVNEYTEFKRLKKKN